MDRRLCFVVLVLAISWCCSAKDLAGADLKRESLEKEVEAIKLVSRDEDNCSLCVKYVSEAVAYFSNEQNRREIKDLFLKECYKKFPFAELCNEFWEINVAPIISAIPSIQPEAFCHIFCEKVVFISQYATSNSSCDLCRCAVMEAIQQLKNPDTQVEVLPLLLKACDSTKNFSTKCKKLVFEHAAVILVNAEQFLQTNDVCTLLHVCDSPALGIESLPRMEESRHNAS